MSTTITTWLLQLRDRITSPLRNVQGQTDRTGDAFDKAQARASSLGSTIKRIAAAYAGMFALKNTAGAAADMEQTNVAFEVMLGNAEKGRKMTKQLTDFANATPYVAEHLQAAAKTMLGFGIAAEQVMPNLKAIGNIAMGGATKLSSLSLAFSQTSATGKLMGQDLLQMINAGFNPLEAISRKTGKSVAVLKEEMSKGCISAQMVREAFLSAAGAGGRFGGMMERMSETTKGKAATFFGQLKQAGVEIGNKLLPIINNVLSGGLKLAAFLQQHATTILKIATGVGVLIGVIKAVNVATALWTVRIALLNGVMAMNPIVAIIGLVAGLTAAIFAFNKASTTAAKVQAGFTKSLVGTRMELDRDFLALMKTKEGTDERRAAIEEINTKYGEYLGNLLTEKSTLEEITAAQNQATMALAHNIALKTQQEKIGTVVTEAQTSIEKVFNNIIDKVAKRQGTATAGLAAKDLHSVIESIRNNPDASAGENDFRQRYGLGADAMWLLKQTNSIRDAVRKSNYEQYHINRFFEGYLSGFKLTENTGGKTKKDKATDLSGSDTTDADGIKLGGSGGSKGAITMNVTMNNTFHVANDMDVKNVAEQIFRMVNDRFRDGLVTAGG